MATFVVIQVVVVEGASAMDAISLVQKVQEHTPLGKACVSAIEVEGEGREMAGPALMEVGKWLASIYPEVVAHHRKETLVMDTWGKFLCEMEEGLEAP